MLPHHTTHRTPHSIGAQHYVSLLNRSVGQDDLDAILVLFDRLDFEALPDSAFIGQTVVQSLQKLASF